MPNTNHSVADAALCSHFVQSGVWAKWLHLGTEWVAWSELSGKWCEMEKDFKWHPNAMPNFMATLSKSVLLLFSVSSPNCVSPPNMFITFVPLRSSQFHLWMCHSEQLCLSFIFPHTSATNSCGQLWCFLLLPRDLSAILVKAQVCVAAYRTSWF